MRPINLIPEEERRSHGASSRTGPVAYIFVGSLAALLIGVVLLVLTGNDIAAREGRIERLQTRKTALNVRAEKLAPYVSFHTVAEQRTQTVYSLADSRFDWSRVIEQLALVVPREVILEKLAGSAGGGEDQPAGVTGPALVLNGCAPGQKGVAAFSAALKDIDGVTRVGLKLSTRRFEKLEADEVVDRRGACGGSNQTYFELVVAFDAAPPSPNTTAGAISVEGEAASEGEAAAAGEAGSEEPAPAPESDGSSEAAVSSLPTPAAG